MTERMESVRPEFRSEGNEGYAIFAELHHISHQLEELIGLVKGGTFEKTENIPTGLSPNNNEVMTVKEAAALMRISLPKMYEFARSGKVHHINVGRRILISRSSLMALIKEGEENGYKTC